MSPFSRDYQPIVNLNTKADIKSARLSAHKTAQREKDLASPDPKVRAAAAKKFTDLSSRSKGA